MKPHLLLAAPWPPARSEIANNVADTQLPALAAHATLTLLGEQVDVPDGARLHGMAVESVEAALKQNPDAALIAHIGNQPEFSAAGIRALARRPGFVVLHDLVLHHAFYTRCHAEHREADYLAALHRYYGGRAEKMGRFGTAYSASTIRHIAGKYPLFEPFLDNALGVVTHSRMAYEAVADRERWPVCQLGLPYDAPAAATRRSLLEHRAAQAEALAAGGPFKLLVFGHLGLNRGLFHILDALASLNEPRLSLDIYGTVADLPSVEQRIAGNGLQQAVRIHGHVPEAELVAALHTAHLAINLRSPTLGEASASQLRLYAAALPAILTRHGWYAEQPESAVLFVRSGYEFNGLTRTIRELLNAPDQLPALAAAGLDHLRDAHNPSEYASGLIEFVERAANPGRRLLLAGRYTDRAAQCLDELGITPTHALPMAIDELLPTES